jgi:hypothetical protein
MAADETMYIANLAFLLNYDQGVTNDEIEYEIFKVAFQDKESVHYDRSLGGNFMDLEQEPANIATGLLFSSNIIESIFYVNQEKNNNPYIIVGYSDILIDDQSYKDGSYLVQVNYRLLSDITQQGTVSI